MLKRRQKAYVVIEKNEATGATRELMMTLDKQAAREFMIERELDNFINGISGKRVRIIAK